MDSPELASGAQAAKAIVWTENSRPHARQERQASLIVGFGGPTETKKARSVVASSRVPRWAGFAGSPPAAGLPRTVNWPLVQIPADRHTTTGTCVLGKPLFGRNALKRKSFFRLSLKFTIPKLPGCRMDCRVAQPTASSRGAPQPRLEACPELGEGDGSDPPSLSRRWLGASAPWTILRDARCAGSSG